MNQNASSHPRGNTGQRIADARHSRATTRLAGSLPAVALVLALSACGGGGGSSAAPAPAPAPANVAPTARIIASTLEGFAPLDVQFDGTTSSDSDGTIGIYNWDFGDGATTTGSLVNHRFDEPGLFTVELRVTDDDGLARSSFVSVRARGAQLSGTISILASSAVDSDVNDPATFAISNNSFVESQPIGNPVRVGGYVNLPGTGAPGNLFVAGDAGDFYAVNLTGNEIILLSMAEPDADLDLILWDSAQNLVDASLGVEATESIVVSQPGDYFIEVFPADATTNLAGASNYVLTIGQDLTSNHLKPSRLSDPFVPGELLMTTRSAGASAMVNANYALQPRGRAGAVTRLGITNAPQTLRALSRSGRNPLALPSHGTIDHNKRSRYETLLAIKAIRRDADVMIAEPNLIRTAHAHLTPNDPLYTFQWHYEAIKLPAAWDLTMGDSVTTDPVIVAVIDTGILAQNTASFAPQHPDLLNTQFVTGFDFISSAAIARDGDGIDPNPRDEGDLAYGISSSFHGTHVSGTIAAETNNGEGVAGVSWGAKIMPLRALGVGGGTSFDIMQAMRYAAGLSNNSGTVPPRAADIINLSLGGGLFSTTEQNTITEVRGAGTIVIASAGNSASSQPSYPAAYNGVVSVSATTISGGIASYSNFGNTIDVAAPGGFNATDLNGDGIGDGVISALADDTNPNALLIGYAALSGTSMAAPHVAGVAALMKAVHPGLTPDEFDMALLAGDLTDDLGTPGRDDFYGHGLINAHKAVLTALDLASTPVKDPGPILSASASSLNFGVLVSQLELVLENIGTGNINIDDIIIIMGPWLRVESTSDGTDGLGTYSLHIDRSVVPADGSYTATVEFVPAPPATSVTVSVLMQVASDNPTADAGLHFVILVNEFGQSVVPPIAVSATNGAYTFTITDVPIDAYRLFGGSDMDNDGFLCDAGEACGAFRNLDAPEVLNVDGNITPQLNDLDFVSEFRAVISGQAQSNAADASATGGIRYRGTPDSGQPGADKRLQER